MKNLFFVFLSCLVLFSCKKEEQAKSIDPCLIDNLTGTYNNTNGSDEANPAIIITKSGNNILVQILDDDGEGFQFETPVIDCQFAFDNNLPSQQFYDIMTGIFEGNTLTMTGSNDSSPDVTRWFWVGSK